MIIQKRDYRKRETKGFSMPLYPLFILIVLVIALFLLPNPTSSVTYDLDVNKTEYNANEELNIILDLGIEVEELLPLDTKIQFDIFGAYPAYYMCDDGDAFLWVDINGTDVSPTGQPWVDFCNEVDLEMHNCSDYSKICCPYGVKGKNYANLLCEDISGEPGYCGDICNDRIEFELIDLIHASSTPNKGHFISGEFKYKSGDEIISLNGFGDGVANYNNGTVPIPDPYISATCNDSDGGINYYLNGRCQDGVNKFDDMCIGESLLREYYCKNDELEDSCGSCGDVICDRIGTGMEGWYVNCSDGEHGPIAPPGEYLTCEGLDPDIYAPICVNESVWVFPAYCASETPYCSGNCYSGVCNYSSSNATGWDNHYIINLKDLNLKSPSIRGYYYLFINILWNETNIIPKDKLNTTFKTLIDPRHRACINESCVWVDGEGEDQCSEDSDCECVSNWSCTNWTSCINGVKTKYCYDENGCRENRTITQNCSGSCTPSWSCSWNQCGLGSNQEYVCTDIYNCNPSNSTYTAQLRPCCVEDWQCTSWGKCEYGTQTRTCTDSENCGTEFNKPAETQNCEERKTSDFLLIILIIIIAGLIVVLLLMRNKIAGIFSKKQIVSKIDKEQMQKEKKLAKIASASGMTQNDAHKMKELQAYVKKALHSGLSRRDVETLLIEKGWPQKMIDEAFRNVLK